MQSGSTLSGILVTIVFGALAIGGMVWAIIYYAGHGHDDLFTFDVSVAPNAATVTTPVSLTGGKEVSVWLLTNSRLLELKSVRVEVGIETGTGQPLTTIGQDFEKMTLRNRYGDKVYYWLGDFTPASDGAYRLNYKRGGDWAGEPPPTQLVIRRSVPVSLPWGAVVMMLIGAAGIYAGIRMLTGGGK